MPRESPPITRAAWPPAADYAPASRCPVCGQKSCPEEPGEGVPATWFVLVLALVSILAALGWVAWWLGWGGGAAVIARGLEGLW